MKLLLIALLLIGCGTEDKSETVSTEVIADVETATTETEDEDTRPDNMFSVCKVTETDNVFDRSCYYDDALQDNGDEPAIAYERNDSEGFVRYEGHYRLGQFAWDLEYYTDYERTLERWTCSYLDGSGIVIEAVYVLQIGEPAPDFNPIPEWCNFYFKESLRY